MSVPNGDRAIIKPSKIKEYLLNPDHERGGSKAKLLLKCGYSIESWHRLESDIRKFHLNVDVCATRLTPYGMRYEVVASLPTPSGRQLPVKTVWQIDNGTNFPRLVTLVPE